MKKKLVIILSIASSAALFNGCYYDKAEQVYPQPTVCDTVNMRYSTDIVGILAANCYSCHSGTASASGGRKFDQYDLLKNNYINTGVFKKAITHAPGASPMPKNMPKLPECTINKVIAWLDRGAPNN
jgi:hypothetical protein